MNESGRHEFLLAEGGQDWVVLHGGATAVFRTGSLADAARLAESIAKIPALQDSGVVLTVAATHLTVRLSRDVWRLESKHVELARSVSAVARAHGAPSDRAAVQEVQFAIAAKQDEIDSAFWCAVLGYEAATEENMIDPLGNASTVWMQALDEAKPLRHAMHIDVSVAREHAVARLDAALAAGGRIVDESHAPSYWTLADRAENRVCICSWPDDPAPKK